MSSICGMTNPNEVESNYAERKNPWYILSKNPGDLGLGGSTSSSKWTLMLPLFASTYSWSPVHFASSIHSDGSKSPIKLRFVRSTSENWVSDVFMALDNRIEPLPVFKLTRPLNERGRYSVTRPLTEDEKIDIGRRVWLGFVEGTSC
jgi:hypothetical protein